MTTMYGAKVNSPLTQLSAAITAIATTIPLVDASLVPDAPNIATIGTGEDAETILYAAKSSNDLTSVTREFQGTAIAWPSGTSVYRAYTAYDHDTFKSNIEMILPIGATSYVVANDAPAEVKTYATFLRGLGYNIWLCDGTDDQIQIQAAIDALTTGGKVTLSQGTFYIDAQVYSGQRLGINIMIDDITLQGQGESTVLSVVANANLDRVIRSALCWGLVIRDLVIDGNKANQASGTAAGITVTGISNDQLHTKGRSTVENVYVKNTTGDGISLGNSEYSHITRCKVTEAVHGAISGDQFDYSTIEKCLVWDCDDLGIAAGSSDGTTIVNNVIINVGRVSGAGIDIGDSVNAIVAYNTLINLVGSGIWGELANANVLITLNIIDNCGGKGIEFASTSAGVPITISFNSIDLAGDTAIKINGLSRVKITNNNITNGQNMGIQLMGYTFGAVTTECEYCEILDNTIYNCGLGNPSWIEGICLRDTTQYTRVEGNDIDGGGNQRYGVQERDTSDNNYIQRNTVRNNAAEEILYAGASTIVRDNTGFITENSGVASNVTLDAGGIGVIPHGCAITPTYANVQCQSDNLNVRVSSIDATNINILVKDLAGAVVTADTHDFYWRAQVAAG